MRPGIGSLVGQGKPTGMAKHMGMRQEGQGGGLAASVEKQIDGRAVQRLRRRTKAQVSLPSEDAMLLLLYGLLRSG